jgi:hypothetical protein
MSGHTTTSLTWHYAFSVQKVWIDLLVFGILAVVHMVANWDSPNLPTDPPNLASAFSLVKELAATSLTVVGILLPLSLAAVGTLATKHTVQSRVLANIFIGDAWLVLSLTLGLHVLWTAGFRAHTENVQNRRDIRIFNGWQLGALLAGIVRLLIATFFLVQTPR